jgi:hypothetical protein
MFSRGGIGGRILSVMSFEPHCCCQNLAAIKLITLYVSYPCLNGARSITCGTMPFASRCARARALDAPNDVLGTKAFKANAPIACNSLEGARRTAESLALNNAGVVVVSMTSNPETGDYDDEPTVFWLPRYRSLPRGLE